MSRNGSGTYTLPSGNPVVSGTLIEASWANTTLSDLASAMTDSLSRSGQGGMTAALRLFDGTSSVPGLAWGSETTTGWYRAGAGDMRLVVTGSEIMRYQASGVAITGTLSASGNATVGGTLAVTGAATFSGQTVTLSNSTAFFPQLINRNTTADANASYLVLDKIRGSSVVQNGDVLGNLVFRGFDGTQYLQGAYINAIVNAAPGTNDMPAALTFGVTADGGSGPSEQMRLTSTGLGIGTASPGYKLTVAGGDIALDNTRAINFKNSSGAYGNVLSVNSSNQVNFGDLTTSASAMVLSSGNLGLGTASPQGRLHVRASTATVFFQCDDTGQVQLNFGGTTNAVKGGIYFSDNSDVMWFRTGSTERARIDSSGNLLVGATSAGGVGATLQPFGTLILNNNAAASGFVFQTFRRSAVEIGYIDQTGTTGVRYATSSDYRLKENIQPMTGALEKISALKPCTYKWKGDGSDGQGFIAHELQEVFPDAVTRTKDAVDAEGNPQYQGIDTSFLVATLTAAIQELKAEFDAYKATHP